MDLKSLEDKEVSTAYRQLRKQVKHEKKGRGSALCPEHKRMKIECLRLKDEMVRRKLPIPSESDDGDHVEVLVGDASGAILTVIDGGFKGSTGNDITVIPTPKAAVG